MLLRSRSEAPLHRPRPANCHADVTKNGRRSQCRRPSRSGPVLVQEIENERCRPRELLSALASARHGAVVLAEAGASRQLDDRAANVGGEQRVPVAIEPALENPVEDRPDRASPVAGRLEARIARRLARDGPADCADRRPASPRVASTMRAARGRASAPPHRAVRDPPRVRAPTGASASDVVVDVHGVLLVPERLVEGSGSALGPALERRRVGADDARDLGQIPVRLDEQGVEENGLDRERHDVPDARRVVRELAKHVDQVDVAVVLPVGGPLGRLGELDVHALVLRQAARASNDMRSSAASQSGELSIPDSHGCQISTRPPSLRARSRYRYACQAASFGRSSSRKAAPRVPIARQAVHLQRGRSRGSAAGRFPRSSAAPALQANAPSARSRGRGSTEPRR